MKILKFSNIWNDYAKNLNLFPCKTYKTKTKTSKNAPFIHWKSEFFKNFALALFENSYISFPHQEFNFQPSPFPQQKHF